MRFLEVPTEHATAELTIDDRHKTPVGAIHTDVLVVVADSTATALAISSAAARRTSDASSAREGGDAAFFVASNLHAVFLANPRGGTIRAESRVVRPGRRLVVVRTIVTSDAGRPLCEVTTTHVPA